MKSITEVRKQLRENREMLMGLPNVNGVGVGRKNGDGDYAVVAFVVEKKPALDLKEEESVPSYLEGVQTDVVEVGEISVFRTNKQRPLVGGISAGHVNVTAGTLGGIFNRERDAVLLSNNHVFANSNDATIGDNILQPGVHDGGTEVVANLLDYVPINFGDSGGTCPVAKTFVEWLNEILNALGRRTRVQLEELEAANVVDAAIALPKVEYKELIFEISGPVKRVGEAVPGDVVVKSGRTTGVTEGEVQYTDATVNVNFGAKGTARFDDQLVTSHMSEGGDSGSVILRDDRGGWSAVGLLFAGSSEVTIANRMSNVFDELNLST